MGLLDLCFVLFFSFSAQNFGKLEAISQSVSHFRLIVGIVYDMQK